MVEPPLDPPGRHRFDDPRGEFVVRYVGASLRGCLLETMAGFRRGDAEAAIAAVQGVGAEDRVPSSEEGAANWLAMQRVATVAPADEEAPKIIDVNDATVLAGLDKHPLVRDAIEASGLGTPLAPQHLDEALIRLTGPVGRRITQAVSRAVAEWLPDTEAIVYRSHHDDGEVCAALFDGGRRWQLVDVRQLDPRRDDDKAAVQSVAAHFEIDLPPAWRSRA